MNGKPSFLTVLFFTFALCVGIVILMNVFLGYYDFAQNLRTAQSQSAAAEVKAKEHSIKDLALRKVRFSVNLPAAENVYLVADFSLWQSNKIKLNKSASGVFSELVVLPPGNYKYYFEVDGNDFADPANTDYDNYGGRTVNIKTVK